MSILRPFVAWLPDQRYVTEVVCPPLGELTTTEWLAMSHDNPHSFLNVIRTEVDTETGEHDPAFYSKSGRDRLDAMVDEGVLRPMDRPAFYIYRIATVAHTATALVAAVHVAGYLDGLVVRHEHTRRATEDLIVEHMQRVRAHSDPVALAHAPDSELKRLIEQATAAPPMLDFEVFDGGRQTVWVVADPGMMAAIQDRIDRIPRLYITDGHHRAAAASRFARGRDAANPAATGIEGYHYFLGALYAEDDLHLRAFHRCVGDLGLEPADVVTLVGSVVDLEPAGTAIKPGQPGDVLLIAGGVRYRFRLPGGDADHPYDNLDVVRLQRHILTPVLGIADPREDPRLHYVGLESARPAEHGCVACFMLHPTSVGEVMRVADAGLVMPPKSTWFEPKVWGGLFVSSVDVRI
ncbi:MAG TPA: DUF1015 domain-containing protein [Acidimicrobiia bacterium]|nr:DUF1015 domain-containing protein [Acidimicrobiia bacterium]